MGRFLFQQRDHTPGVLHPGKVALFGGHREGDETYLECAVRELHEELSYLIPPERFMHLKTVAGSDLDVEGGTVQGGIVVIQDIPVEDLTITEGSFNRRQRRAGQNRAGAYPFRAFCDNIVG
jgi:8-oxo-dGTP diphosphatase